VPGSHRWTRDGSPLPQAATIAREKMEKAKAAGGGDDLDAASFTTEMDALHDDVLNADVVVFTEATLPTGESAAPGSDDSSEEE